MTPAKNLDRETRKDSRTLTTKEHKPTKLEMELQAKLAKRMITKALVKSERKSTS